MLIEFSNATPQANHSAVSVAIIAIACLFFFVPTSLILLGYLSSKPTGSLISPLPQGIITSVTPTRELPLVAAATIATASPEISLTAQNQSNMTDKTATISAGTTETLVKDQDIKSTSQIYLTPHQGDKSIYSVKSKQDGQMIISSILFDTDRYIDYHIVNP